MLWEASPLNWKTWYNQHLLGADQVRARALTHTPAVPTAVTDGMDGAGPQWDAEEEIGKPGAFQLCI